MKQGAAWTVNSVGRRTSLTRPNGVNTSYSYDSLSRLLSVLHQANSATLDGVSYVYDAAGNRTSKTVLPSNLTSAFSYDPTYQLTQVMQGTKKTESYTYDAVGNRTYQPGAPYTYNSSNEMLTREGVPYTYDADGNLLSKTNGSGTTSYAWDFENRLSGVTLPSGNAISFKYDPLGRRIYKNSPAGTTIYVYDGNNIIEEMNGTGSLQERYTYGPGTDEPLVGQRQPKIFFYEADGLGSVTSLTDPTGAVAATYSYDSFGFLTSSTGSATNWFRYTARQFDSDTALYYYRARYYDPTIGRFISEDPIGFRGGKNFYAYVGNGPVNLTDPLGLCDKNKNCIPWSSLSFLQQAILNGLSALAQNGGVRALGAGGAAAFSPVTIGGGGGSGQALWIADYLGQKGLYWSVSGGPTAGQPGVGALGGLQYMTSTFNATVTVQDVVNSSVSLGFAGAAGLGAGVDYNPQTQVVTGTIGAGLGGWGGTGGLNAASGFVPICPE